MAPVKILVMHRFNPGGGFIFTHYLCNALVDLGYKITCIYLKERPVRLKAKPVMFSDARYKVVWLNTFLVIEPWQLKRFVGVYLKKRRVEVIISTGSEGVYLQGLCSKRNIFHIASYHSPDFFKMRRRDLFQLKWLNLFNLGEWCRHLYIFFEQQRLKKADLVHCVSQWQKEVTCKHLHIPENKMVVVHNGVDLIKFSPASDVKKSGILYCGGLLRGKGIDTLLEAFALVSNRHKVSLNIIGFGDWPSYLKKAKALGIDEEVRYMGYVAYEKISEYFKKAYLFVAPTELESFSLVIVEAMASGLPVISTLSSSIPEIVENGVTGLLVPWNDTGALAQAMIRLLDNPQLAQSMGERGRIRVEKNFRWEQTAEGLVKYIKTWING